jgi:nicotinamide-nucleotide amidase
VGVVESCTGGLLGAMLAGVPGASDVLWGGLITYDNRAKELLAGVDPALLAAHGAVSAPVAAALATGGLERLGVDHALAITGVAGPGGGSAAKPVGTVYVARAARGEGGGAEVRRFAFAGDRQSVREWAARSALAMLRLHLDGLGNLRLLREVSGEA